MDLSNKLQILRKCNGFTQEELAEKIGVSRQAVAKWEQSQAIPDIEKLVLLSNIFQVTIDYLVKDKEECSVKEAVESSFQNQIADDKNTDNIWSFLCRAKRATYAGKGTKEEVSLRPNSIDYIYREGDMQYIDTYLGGEMFAGEEAVYIHSTPFWIMNYCGRVLEKEFSGDILKEALYHVSEEQPYRGPNLYKNGSYTYICQVSGDKEWFVGNEVIYCLEKKVYECNFHGSILR